MTDDIKAAWQKIHADVSAASYPTTFEISTERGRELDKMSIVDWINETFEGGNRLAVGQLLDVAYNIEYGAECTEQSSLNLLYLLGYRGQGQFRVFGESNEKYHVVGGNDQITDRLAAKLPARSPTGSELVAVRRNASGTFTLTFAQQSGTKTVTADKVVLALPFSILRSSVDLSKAGFEPLKLIAIREQGMGTNSKLHVQFSSRFWRAQGSNGETFADTRLPEHLGGHARPARQERDPGRLHRRQDRRELRLGHARVAGGSSSGSSSRCSRARRRPGTARRRSTSGLAYRWTKGSYSYWKVGQYQRFAGIEGRRQGNCHFAGEHTSIDFQGYLNGAVETGQRAAGEILADLK